MTPEPRPRDVSDNEIMQKAYEKANALLQDAQKQADGIVNNAVADADQIPQQCDFVIRMRCWQAWKPLLPVLWTPQRSI